MKELPDSTFNMREQFYQQSKEYTMKNGRNKLPVKIRCYVAHSLESAKKVPFWFRIEQIQNGYWQVYTCRDEELLQGLGQTIVYRRGG